MNKRQRKKAAKYWFVRELRKRYRREALVVQRYMARVYRDGWPAPGFHLWRDLKHKATPEQLEAERAQIRSESIAVGAANDVRTPTY